MSAFACPCVLPALFQINRDRIMHGKLLQTPLQHVVSVLSELSLRSEVALSAGDILAVPCSCRITEDVCAYPSGDLEAYRAVSHVEYARLPAGQVADAVHGRQIRTMAVWSGKNTGTCVSDTCLFVDMVGRSEYACLLPQITKFRRFICGMYFPKCRFHTTIPVCSPFGRMFNLNVCPALLSSCGTRRVVP